MTPCTVRPDFRLGIGASALFTPPALANYRMWNR